MAMSVRQRLFLLVPALLGLAALSAGLFGLQSIHRIVQATPALQVDQPKSVIVAASDGRLLRPFTTASGHWRIPVTLDEVDPRLIDFLTSYEDRRFFEHDGVDRRAILRAAGQMLWHGKVVSGASTLTMQVARLLSDGNTKSLSGKIRQAAQAQMLEQQYSKQDILELYLNHAPYGGNLEGVRAASWAYFGKEPKWLNLSEIALLVALPQAPESRRPDRHYENAYKARARVLARFVADDLISVEDSERASNAPLPSERQQFPMIAPHLAHDLRKQNPDQTVFATTIDLDLQKSLETHVAQRIAALGRGFSIAIMVVDHTSGAVKASISGGGLLSDTSAAHLNLIRAVRSPGSTLKPLIYGLGFEAGIAHPSTLIDDSPRDFSGYTPKNFDTGFHGTMSIAEALQRSLNIPAIAVLERVDPHRLVGRLRRVGASPKFPKGEKPGLAMGLGGVGLTLEDMVQLYGSFASGGQAMALNWLKDEPVKAHGGRVLGAQASKLLIKALQHERDKTHAMRRNLVYKTGTSYGYRDAWTIGFDGKHVVGVWVGRPDNASAGHITGATAALPLFLDVYARLGTVPQMALQGEKLTANADLPAHLRNFGKIIAGNSNSQINNDPAIAFPPQNSEVPLGYAANIVSLKVRGGSPPYRWLANGKPITRRSIRKEASFEPDGPGFTTLTVIDAKGLTDQINVRFIR